MALLRFSDIKKMDKKAREEKFKELKLELIKSNVAANRAGAKTKEIKKAIARLIMFNISDKEVLNKK
jgi:ribosomal protein L29